MKKIISLLLVGIMLTGCNSKNSSELMKEEPQDIKVIETSEDSSVPWIQIEKAIINADGEILENRFNVPDGFERIPVEDGSFAKYLRELPLKESGQSVYYYNGNEKKNHGVYEAVVDMDIGDRDLQQCADAIMRLRGEYLYRNNRFDEIHFNLTNGFRMDYKKWTEGNRLVVEGSKTYWDKRSPKSNKYEDFRNYMDIIFTYAGTLSLSQELDSVDCNDMEIGDVFIQGGSPGHAVIVVDMALNKDTGEKCFILAQSYMPAQDIQILSNQYHEDRSPWYNLGCGEIVRTPEWTFTRNDLKRFDE